MHVYLNEFCSQVIGESEWIFLGIIVVGMNLCRFELSKNPHGKGKEKENNQVLEHFAIG